MNEENDSIKQIEQSKLRIIRKGIVHQSLLEYLGLSADQINKKTKKDVKTEDIYQILKKSNILTNKCEFREFLGTISHLWKMHNSKKEMKYKIESLIKILQKDFKSVFSEKEIYSFFDFCNNNYIFLILVEQNIISIKTIIEINHWNKIMYFYPEIRKYDEKYLNQLIITDKRYRYKEFIEENDQNLEIFIERRKEGKMEPKIVELIREDKIEEFIYFIEHSPINLNERIQRKETILGSYTKDLTPIEYSALFGAVAIFKYLYLKKVDIIIFVDEFNNNIIEYAIQGRNYEIIHLLEGIKEIIEELNQNKLKYIEVSIKMHYNEIFEYLITNYNSQVTEEIIETMIIYRNYHLFNQIIELNQIELNDRAIISKIFHSICQNWNEEIVKTLINQPNLDINSKDYI